MAAAPSTSSVTKVTDNRVPSDAASKPHHVLSSKGNLSKFANPHPSWDDGVLGNPIRALFKILGLKWQGKIPAPDTTPPTVTVRAPTFLPSRYGSTSLRATWLGHACYYVEYPSGLRVLFDPVFEDRCSPMSFMGPKRFTKQPCAIADIPIVDAVVISHSHYDHLSNPSVQEIHKHHPEAHFFVGLGLEKWFRSSGITKVTELDWWEDADFTVTPATTEGTGAAASDKATGPAESITARISCLPAQHTSGRTGLDKDTTLWCSWAVSSGKTPETSKSVWFGGDTGYRNVPETIVGDDYAPEHDHLPRCPQFAQIGALRGPFDLGLIPIGAYAPRFLFSSMHANPFDAVEIFTDTKCARAMGIHWGTWALTFEEVLEPPKLLRQALARKGIAETSVFDVCDIGESREF
ncbi:putative Zn-dependent hydrolase/oxidoreductase family protein [Podospora didyma]|uniref:Zn-dependent hydrolase/oxidoreductase family protein n=1 Tax=Podospora didyma TaxID=330526 RepID=A0AAE0NX98_9PEZI|nr:putative Zn-dependent hydrolase/oxidoreductase family protein [Podospora didyma]